MKQQQLNYSVVWASLKIISNLKSANFDELFEPIHDEELVMLVIVGNVSSVEPIFRT